MTTPCGVSAGKSKDFLVVEAHATKDTAEMVVAFRAVWQTSIGCAIAHIMVLAAWSPLDVRPTQFLDGAD